MNQLAIPQAPQLPSHLANFADLGFSLNESVVGGMKTGGHPSIGIKQAKWRIREGAYEEVVNSFTLNVIIVNANKHLSKVFYLGAYTGEEGKAPDCFSDNGVSPSAQASAPQCATCAMCPNNVWGSKISPSGAKIKACSDYKKLAVILADDPDRDVYELRIPGASLSQLNEIMTKLIKSGVPIPAIVFELSFDANVDYPKVVFKPLTYVSETQANSIRGWVNSDEAKQAVGENDVPVQNFAALPQPQTQIAALPNHVVPPAAAPHPAADPLGFLNQPLAPNGTPVSTASVASQTAVAPKGRGRPKKSGEPQAVYTGGGPIGGETPIEVATRHLQAGPIQMDLPGMQSPAQATPINPAKTDASLDALLAGIL